MTSAYWTISIIPSSQFKWTAQVQYKESLPNRDEAISYASRHGCNLIVQYSRRSGPLFDVLQDPELESNSETNSDFAEAVAVEYEPERTSWSRTIFRNVFGLARRLGASAIASQHQNPVPSA